MLQGLSAARLENYRHSLTVCSLGASSRCWQSLTSSCTDIDSVLSAIERLRQPADSKNDEEQIIRMGPHKAGISRYLQSITRLNWALSNMKASNLRSTQQTTADLQRLVRSGNTALENHFDKILRAETPPNIEPLQYVTKNQPFP